MNTPIPGSLDAILDPLAILTLAGLIAMLWGLVYLIFFDRGSQL